LKIRLLASATIQDAVQAIDQVAQKVAGDPKVLEQGALSIFVLNAPCVVWTKGQRI